MIKRNFVRLLDYVETAFLPLYFWYHLRDVNDDWVDFNDPAVALAQADNREIDRIRQRIRKLRLKLR